jgi:hypothetical protein
MGEKRGNMRMYGGNEMGENVCEIKFEKIEEIYRETPVLIT